MLAVEPGRRRRAVLTEHCRTAAARVVGTEPARIDTSAPLTSMGFDSLLSLELRKALESGLRLELPSTVTWRFPTIDALVPYLAERMGIPLEAVEAAGTATGGGPSAGIAVADPPGATRAVDGEAVPPDLDAMSATELEALVLAKTRQIDEGGRR
jgi:acyl carrier protein